jgi:tRNA 2-thiouridine synthesizing protein A
MDQGLVLMDCVGMRCPQPVLRLAVETAETPPGTIIQITGDCRTFEKDIRTYCQRRQRTILSVRAEADRTIIQLRC